MPALERGAAKAGRSLSDIELSGPAFVVTGTTEEEMAASAVGVRKQIAFYGSTPAYRGVLERHGWGELQTELNGLSKQGRWDEMGTLIDDDMLDTFAIIGEPEQIAPKMRARYGDVVDRISFYVPYRSDPDRWSQVMADLKAA